MVPRLLFYCVNAQICGKKSQFTTDLVPIVYNFDKRPRSIELWQSVFYNECNREVRVCKKPRIY